MWQQTRQWDGIMRAGVGVSRDGCSSLGQLEAVGCRAHRLTRKRDGLAAPAGHVTGSRTGRDGAPLQLHQHQGSGSIKGRPRVSRNMVSGPVSDRCETLDCREHEPV